MWSDARSGAFDLYAQRMTAAGSLLWTAGGVAISTLIGSDYAPALIPDGTGGAIIAWQLDSPGGAIYVQRVDASGAAQWPAIGPKTGVTLTATFGELPTITPDGSGGAIVTWQDFRLGTLDIYAQRIDAAGTPLWTAGGVAVCTAANDQVWPNTVSDGTGGAIMVWHDQRTGFDIYMERLDASGSPRWGTGNGVFLGSSTNFQNPAQLVTDGAGGAIVTWETDQANLDIIAQRVSAAGVAQWAGGALVCADANAQLNPQIVSDGAAGAIITWQDNRNGPADNVYAQHVGASGVSQWTPNGIALSSGSAQLPVIATNGAGGAIIAWDDSRDLLDHHNILGAAVSAWGAPGWPMGGISICSATEDQSSPRIESNDGVTIVAWQDRRNGNYDIYAKPTNIASGVRDTPSVPTLSLTPNYPNPFGGRTALSFVLASDANVNVDVFDAAGHRVRHDDLGHINAGWNQMSFDGRDDAGRSLPSGVYFYRVHAGNQTVTKKMVIAR